MHPWLRLWLWDYSDWYIVLVLRSYYSPPAVFSIKIYFKTHFAQKQNNQNTSHNSMTCIGTKQ